MSITVQLRDSVRLPGGEALVSGFALEGRSGSRRALLRSADGAELAVHELSDLLSGRPAPTAVFPVPWPRWDLGVHSVSPDARFAVFAGQRAVRAVAADGATLWEYPHACWGPIADHEHSGDEQEVCYGHEHGSCRVSEDGRLVWAHVPAEDLGELWVVLDARDGRELARLPLDSVASGSHQLAHPDGVHVGLCVGMGQDGILTFWARWDGTELTSWDLNEEAEDRILGDVHPAHAGFLTVEHYGGDLRLHALDGSVLAEAEPPELWDHTCGFVDADTVIASTTEADEDAGEPRHWLLDARSLRVLGPIAYPGGPVDGHVRPLGDGSWLTYDDQDGTLHRWSRSSAAGALSNARAAERRFLAGMYRDAYFPDALVDLGRDILLRLCERIETERPTDLTALYRLSESATEEFNELQERFEEADSDIETVARELIAEEFRFIARAYGFADADPETLVAARDW